MGVLLGLPSVGCAKSLLVGDYREPGDARGAWKPIYLDGDEVGAAVRTRARVKPLFVSPGHRIGGPYAHSICLGITSDAEIETAVASWRSAGNRTTRRAS
jgi:deoxyribonuclease V